MGDKLPAEADTMYLCVGGRMLKTVFGVFTTEAKAGKWADAANVWYGADHPLTPIRVEPVKVDVRPFPAEAFQRLSAIDEDGPERTDAIAALFETLVDDDEEDEPDGSYEDPETLPGRGGRR